MKKEQPFFSICLAAYNMEQFIESTLLSIINQSFQDLEIILVDDCSKDKTLNILEKFKLDDRIKIIKHSRNLGLYASRVDGVTNSKGKFIILMDPDDMLLNPDILYILYNYYLKFNLDIIEYKTLASKYKSKKLFIYDDKLHYHHYPKKIIYQPELSDLLFYYPGTKNYSEILCKNIWNQMIRKEVLIKTINYLGKDYYRELVITAEDTLFNIINRHFANNYSNINYYGYMYNIREKSITHGAHDKNHYILFFSNYLLYNKKLYTFIRDFNKDRNFLYYELKKRTIYPLKELVKLNQSKKVEVNSFYQEVLEDKNISTSFKEFLIQCLKE